MHVVYTAGTPDGNWTIRLATSGDAGASFSRTTVNDDGPCANHATPNVALDGTGKVHVAWLEKRGRKGRVAYAVTVSRRRAPS